MFRFTWITVLAALWAFQPAASQEPPPKVHNILLAVPFQLKNAYPYDWRAERPWVKTGYVLVLEVTPSLPRQSAEPVLYVGKQTAERLNSGLSSGRMVVIVPGNLADETKADYLDLNQVPIWYGDPDLPERIDQTKVERAFSRAQAEGNRPFAAEAVAEAVAAGGAMLELDSKKELLQITADLIDQYAPEDRVKYP